MRRRSGLAPLLTLSLISLGLGFSLLPSLWAQEEEPAELPTATDAAPVPTPAEAIAAAAAAREAASRELERAYQRMSERDWAGCIEPFLSAVEHYEPYVLLGGLRDQCLYNVACAYARSERPAEAVEAFARSVEHGLRPVTTPFADGTLSVRAGLTFAHILVDSDLDSLRSRDDFRSVLDPLLRGGAPVLEPTPVVPPEERVAGLVVLLSEDRNAEDGGAPWREALSEIPAIVCFTEGPVRPLPGARRWLLSDGDERFAVERIEAAIDLLRVDPRVDPDRVMIAAASPLAAEAALAAVLARAEDVAGFAFGSFSFHAAWHADALAELRETRANNSPWRVVLVAPLAGAAEALETAGAAVEIVTGPAAPSGRVPREEIAALVAARRQAVIDAAAALLKSR